LVIVFHLHVNLPLASDEGYT